MRMPHVLFVAYFFPPHGGAGVQRTLKFVKYLPEFQWWPVILTSRTEPSVLDHSLMDEVDQKIPIYRTPALMMPRQVPWRIRNSIGRWLFLVDEQIGWFPFAVRAGSRIIRRNDIQVIYTTSAPYTSHLIGHRLKQLTGLPWVADFRDSWVGNFARQIPSAFHHKFASNWEERILQNANRVLVVSEPMGSDLLKRHTAIDPGKIEVLTNGFDPQDFDVSEPVAADPDRFLIVYNGSFYNKLITPETFFLAVKEAIQKGNIPANKLCIRLIGKHSEFVSQEIAASGIAELVETIGYLPHKRSLGHLLSADVLLLIISDRPGSEAVYTGKIFEYLAARKPILALAPPGVAADLVRSANAGRVVAPDNVAEISQALVDYYQAWKKGLLISKSDPDIVARFNRRTLTERMAKIFNSVNQAS